MSIRIGQASCGESGIAEQKPGDQTGRELNFAEWYHGTWLAVLRCFAQLLPKLLKGSICAAAERCLRRGFEGFDGSRFQRRFFFDLPHYDACSTRSDSFVVISWYSLPFFGK